MHVGDNEPKTNCEELLRPDSKYELMSLSINGLKWSYLGTAVRVILQLFAQIVIARVIGAAEFGTASAAILIAAFSILFIEMGVTAALVQAKTISDNDIRFAFQRIIKASAIVAGLLFLLADWMADTIWRDAAVAELLRGMCLSVLAQGCGLVALALLRRKLDFKSIQKAQGISYFLGFVCTGITAAWMGAGAWSLVLAWIVQSVSYSALLYQGAKHPATWLKSQPADNSNLVGYGHKILLTNLANWAIENLPNIFVGRFVGSTALGNYTVANNLVRTPTNHLVTSIQQVLFPASARAGSADNSHRTAYLSLIWMISLLVFPIFCSVAAVSQPVIDMIYGARWDEAAQILYPLALAMPFHALMAVGGPILWGRGQAGREMVVQVWVATVFLALLVALAEKSATVMAWGVAGMYVVRCVAVQLQVSASLSIRLVDMARAVVPGMAIGLVALALLSWLDLLATNSHLGTATRLSVAIVGSAICFLSVVPILRHVIPPGLAEAMAASERIPEKLRQLLGLK